MGVSEEFKEFWGLSAGFRDVLGGFRDGPRDSWWFEERSRGIQRWFRGSLGVSYNVREVSEEIRISDGFRE